MEVNMIPRAIQTLWQLPSQQGAHSFSEGRPLTIIGGHHVVGQWEQLPKLAVFLRERGAIQSDDVGGSRTSQVFLGFNVLGDVGATGFLNNVAELAHPMENLRKDHKVNYDEINH